MNKVITIL